MNDLATQLAFQLTTAPGTVAVLLGAGVSRAAGIPSGWEVLAQLIQRVAEARGAAPPALEDSEAWYAREFGEPASYSGLLQKLAPTVVVRQALLREFFERKDPDGTLPQPTKTHHALARLAESGLVRVFISMNFDRLLERALEERGVIPRVIASNAQVAGMIPLAHAGCTVIKPHGDYLSGELRNSDAELARYPKALRRLLERTFDEYGLLTVGWSATWDAALRDAIDASPTRRYPQTFLQVGSLSTVAKELIDRRRMAVLVAGDADSVIPGIAETAIGLAALRTPVPQSEDALVAFVRQCVRRGPLAVMDHELAVVARANDLQRVAASLPTTSMTYAQLWPEVEKLEAATAPAVSMLANAAAFGSPAMRECWVRAIARLAKRSDASGVVALLRLRQFPALLLAYAFAMAAFARRDPQPLRELWLARVETGRRDPQRGVQAFSQNAVYEIIDVCKHCFTPPTGGPYIAPLSERIKRLLRPRFAFLLPEDREFDRCFESLEAAWSLALAVTSATSDEGFIGTHCYGSAGEIFERFTPEHEHAWVIDGGILGASTWDEVAPYVPKQVEQANRASRGW